MIDVHVYINDMCMYIHRYVHAHVHTHMHTLCMYVHTVLASNPRNLDVLWKKASLQCEVGDYTKAVETYQKVMELLSDSQGADYLRVAMEVAKVHTHYTP